MSIDAIKIELLQRLLTIENEDILLEIEKLLDRDLEMNPGLSASIQAGLENIQKGETIPHEEVRKLYDKWLN
jgi:predicted transcriptional regulator